MDVNDNKPVFADINIEKDVPEDENLQSTIATVSANDGDSGVNGMVVYSIVSGNDDNRFYIFAVSTLWYVGKISKKSLWRSLCLVWIQAT